MKDLWPVSEDSFGDTFDAREDSGEPIEDNYGFVSFPSEGAVAWSQQFPSLGISGWELLAFIDPEEHRRVLDAANHRAELRRRRHKTPPDHPEWLIHDTLAPRSEAGEEEVLARAGLTLDKAKELIRRTEGMTDGI